MKNHLLANLRFVLAGVLVFWASLAEAQTVQTLYSTPASPTWRDNYNGASGCLFTVGPSNVVVSHLGYFCSNAVSLAQVQSTSGLITNHYLGIFSANPVQLLVQVIVPSGTGADFYTNQFVWMPLDPPFLLQSNTTYYVAAQTYNLDGDLWGDSFTAIFNSFFLGNTINSFVTAPETAYGPGTTTWPPNGFSPFGTNNANTTYCVEGMANLPIDQARVGVQGTNIFAGPGPLTVVGFASGQPPINYQWWQPGSPPSPVSGQTNANLTFANATSVNSGVYYLTATNALGGETSPNVTVTVSANPVGVQVGATNTTVFNNYPATFSVVVTGSPPISIQWYSNSVPIPNATTLDVNGVTFTNSFTFYAQSPESGFVYSVVASNNINSIAYTATNSAMLTVLPNFGYPQEIMVGPPPTNIFYEPGVQNGMSGDPGGNPTGEAGGNIITGNNPVLITHLGYDAVGLVLNNQLQLNASHHISLYATNGNLLGYVILTNGTPTSTAVDGYLWAELNPPVLLSNNTRYVISGEEFYETDPWGTTYVPTNWNPYITPGGSVNNAVFANSAWPVYPASGGYGSQIYTLPNMGDLVISNEIFSLLTPTRFAQAAGTSATITGYVNGPPPVAVQWYSNGVAIFGQTNIILTISSVPAGTSYYTLLATNTQASLGAISGISTVIGYSSPVVINALPLTYTNNGSTNLMALYAGATPAFSITALGAGTLSYHWYTNGVVVALATNASFRASNVQPGGATNFICIITNVDGSATNIWTAQVLPDPVGAGYTGLAPYPSNILALNPIGYWRMSETNLDAPDDDNGDNGYICHDYVGGNDGIYTNVSLVTPAYNGTYNYNPITDPSEEWSAQFGEDADSGIDYGDQEANSIAGINFATPVGSSAAFTVEAWVSGYVQDSDAGIVSLGWGGGGEQFDLDTGSDGGTPSHAFRFFIRDASGATHLVNSSAYTVTGGNSLGPWTHLAAVVDEISNQTVTLYVNGQNVGSASVTNGSGILTATNASLGQLSLMSIGSRMGAEVGNYNDQFLGNINDVAIYNYALSSNQVLNEYLNGATTAPYFNPTPPTNVLAVVSQPMTIPVTAYGPPPLSYQWVDTSAGNAVLASGSTNGNTLNASFTTNSAPYSMNGHVLELTVTNPYGSTNTFVTVTVTLVPQITANLPPRVSVGQGTSYTYNFAAVGALPLSYQWYEGASGIPGQTNTTYSPSTSSGGTNTFFVIVTNSYGSATSVISTFIVVPLPNTALASYIHGLNPVAYWPMHEVEPAANGDIETNYGTLGAQANGYYADWMQPVSGFQHDYPTTIGGDPNSVFFSITASGGGAVTNGMLVNNDNPGTVLNAPFTVECWCFFTQNVSYGDIWSQNGYEGLNAGTFGGGGGSVCGIRLDWGGNGANELTVYGYDNSSGLNSIVITPTTLPTNTWLHTVVTCDANTNFSIFTNGVLCGSTAAGVGKYSPDYWTPFCVGTGRGYTRSLPQTAVADVAIYTNVVLPTATILNHYNTGINPAPAVSYFNTVMASNPPVFLRMDSPTWAYATNQFPYSSLPVLYNYGSVPGNGVYTPGTVPGIAPGPSTTYTGLTNQGANVAPLSGVSSYADAGYNPAWDPSGQYGTGSNAFSVVAMFRGNPADNTFQDLVGHSDSSWRMTLGANAAGGGAAGSVQFTYGSTASSTISCNDGKWHQAVGVYLPGISAGQPGTCYLYVDGKFNTTSSAVSTNGIVAGSPLDVDLGAAPDYTNNSPGLGRQFDGQLCDVAVFTNALTPSQIQSLYLAAGGVQQTLSISSQLPITRNFLGNNLGNLLGPTNFMTLYAGASPNFLLNVSGSPVYYQWYTNNVTVGFGTNNILTLPNVSLGSFTTYCIATNSASTVTSVVWSASVIADPDPAGSFSQLIISDSPVDYWRLNESAGSTLALDYADGANGQYGSQTTNGLPGAPIATANGEYGVAMDPSASSMPNGTVTNSGIILYTNNVTMICWVLPTALEPNPAGLFENRSSAASSGFQLAGVNSVTNDVDYNWSGSSTAYNYGDPFGIRTGTWGMAVLEQTPSGAQFYVYGTNGLVGTAFNPFASPQEPFTSGNEIGSDPNGGTTRILYGEMNELAIFNYQLSPAQLNALYAAATAGDPINLTGQPVSTTNSFGKSSSFTVGADSLLPLTYQWYYNTVNSYSGATPLGNSVNAYGINYTNVTTGQLAINNLTFGNTGYYYVSVANTAYSTNSAIAYLLVTPSTTSPKIVSSVTANQLTLGWPVGNTGWQLQAQTNSRSVGISTNWFNVSGSTSTNGVVIPINLTNGCVFYRLTY